MGRPGRRRAAVGDLVARAEARLRRLPGFETVRVVPRRYVEMRGSAR